MILAEAWDVAGGEPPRVLKIAVVSISSGAVAKNYYAQAMVNRALYCTRHGYTFRLFPHLDKHRQPAWSKILAMKRVIKEGQHDWLLWMDGDALITNFHVRLESLVPDKAGEEEQFDLVSSRDCNGFNTGIFLLRSHPRSLALLEEIYNGSHVTPETLQHVWWEQKSFIDLYDSREDVRAQVLVVPQKTFNSYPRGKRCSGAGDQGEWSEADFVVHFAGHSDEDREASFPHYLQKVLL